MTKHAEETIAKPGRVASQGVLLLSGFGTAQAFSFIRNALIGHALSKDNFGIAATITLILQMIETLSDLGADRLIIQAPDGNRLRFVAAAHALLVARGVLLGCILFALGPVLAHFFHAEQAAASFQLAALAPLLKGFTHLDFRCAQRNLNNRPQMLVEVVPQALALALTAPMLAWSRDYSAVVSLAVVQALVSVVTSHALATTRYQFAFDIELLKRQLSFGWPILASALPLVAVYQGDRLIIGHIAGVEQLANYSVAFLITMVPGLIAAKVGHALLLPIFSDNLRRGQSLLAKFRLASEATVLLSSIYLASFVVASEAIVRLVFGGRYAGLGAVTSWLAAMWALRMIQAVPGMALMAHGQTKPFLVAGSVRALALPCVMLAALWGAPISSLAAIGVVFEGFSLVYVSARLEKAEPGLGFVLLERSSYLLPAALVAGLASAAMPHAGALAAILLALVVGIVICASGVALMPALQAFVRRALQERQRAHAIF